MNSDHFLSRSAHRSRIIFGDKNFVSDIVLRGPPFRLFMNPFMMLRSCIIMMLRSCIIMMLRSCIIMMLRSCIKILINEIRVGLYARAMEAPVV